MTRHSPSQRVITLFDIFRLAATVAGAIVGHRIGFGVGGTVAGIAGVAVGAALGRVVGRLPFTVSFAWLQRSLKRASTPELRASLDEDYCISHLIIAELIQRGEPVESFREVVMAQLASASPDVRRFGRGNARAWFHELDVPPALD